ncbi:MAG TPA: TonB-dependent receptor [Terriglobales bacterium]|nr:TonB-dependent receptor [Terriglobales bacterium]
MSASTIGQIVLCLTLAVGNVAFAQVKSPPPGITVSVLDENGVVVPSARVFLRPNPQSPELHCETDFTGRCKLPDVPGGTYQLRIEKTGFYVLLIPALQLGGNRDVEARLLHQQEVREVVNVAEPAPVIDPAQTASQEQITGLEIIDVPYPTTRDYRNVLNFIPGVVQDQFGQPHLAGAEIYQALTLLDGFNVTQPANGQLLARVSSDAFRNINVESSRIPAEYGKGSAGVLQLNTGIGDDHYRFSATNFLPSVQNRKGLNFDKVDPRFTVSGPIAKGKIWFYDALEGEYDNVIITDLPDGADNDRVWRVGNLAKVQTNLSSRNILTTSFLYNRLHDEYDGLNAFNPQSATPLDRETAYVGSVKDQHYFAGGRLLEAGFAFVQYGLNEVPHGNLSYFVSPETTGGNYYFSTETTARRYQGLINFYLAPHQWHGRHEFKIGADLDRLTYDATYSRTPISFLREGQAALSAPNACLALLPSPCSRYSTFSGGAGPTTTNVETSGYVQDRWLVTERFLVEPGLRFDWDQIVRRPLFSPRLAAAYVFDQAGNTKISGGIGIVYDQTTLFLIARPFAGQRTDYFFDNSGILVGPPVTSTFSADTRNLRAPRSLNWSVALEQKLPAAIYIKAELLQRRGKHGLVYDALSGTIDGNFGLLNTRKDRYTAFHVDGRKNFRDRYFVFASYTRSRSTSNQVLDFNVDNPILSSQQPGPYGWDAPNRFLSWGLLPFFKLPVLHKVDLAYSLEARSGFPFDVENSQQQLVEPPGSRRFPYWFSLNLHLEKRFHAFGFHWAIRGGFDNITDHKNALFVNSFIDSPEFLTFSAIDRRSFTTRIRFLGRK